MPKIEIDWDDASIEHIAREGKEGKGGNPSLPSKSVKLFLKHAQILGQNGVNRNES
ncbi:hypothetical protein HYR99_07110 [Candidatus Poribacteria bacterium]|nr:hypothetical protein [Candidatus Poribacteria bacterium]